jgi:NADH-ubiquinone oxidoreductase chain 1
MVCLRIRVYRLIFAGWSSNSKYSLLGSLRALAQTISYELPLVFLIFSFSFILFSFDFSIFFYFNNRLINVLICVGLYLLCFICCVAETNRAPFDLAEGESELVSGFNVEYGGLKFALIFMAEYGNIL